MKLKDDPTANGDGWHALQMSDKPSRRDRWVTAGAIAFGVVMAALSVAIVILLFVAIFALIRALL